MVTDIYAVLGDEGEIRYIGQSVSGKGRQRQHWNDRNRRNNKLHQWLRTLDAPPPFRIIAIVEDGEEANKVERACIIALRKLTNGALLNERIKGSISPETRAKLSAAHRGRVVSAETRAKISAANRGRKISAEQLAIMSANAKASWEDPEKRAVMLAGQQSAESRAKRSAANTGKTHSPETRAKLSASKKAQWEDPEYREKTTAAHLGRKATPETRAKITAARLATWSDPAWREQQIARIRAGRARTDKEGDSDRRHQKQRSDLRRR
jgi:hypothetical protein